MKKQLFIITLLSSVLFAISANAQNNCLQQLDQHVNNQQLNLNHCGLKNEDMPVVIAYLKTHQNIRSLNLKDNHINDNGAMMLASGLSVTKLDVSHNAITDVGAEAFAQNAKINSLAIDSQHQTAAGNISDRAAMAFAYDDHLTELAIGGNDAITQDGQLALATTDHFTALTLNVNANHQVLAALANNHMLTKLNVGVRRGTAVCANSQHVKKSHLSKDADKAITA